MSECGINTRLVGFAGCLADLRLTPPLRLPCLAGYWIDRYRDRYLDFGNGSHQLHAHKTFKGKSHVYG
jgi:hypothetical protein